MNEADLCVIRDALAKETLSEAIKAMEEALASLGYSKTGISDNDSTKDVRNPLVINITA